MNIASGRVFLHSADPRPPWSGLVAQGPAIIASSFGASQPASNPIVGTEQYQAHLERGRREAFEALAELDRQSQHARHAGYFSYDLGRCFEMLPELAENQLDIPLLAFVPVVDGAERPPFDDQLDDMPISCGSTFHNSRSYGHAVQRCLDYISAGDVFQVNLSQRMKVLSPADPWVVYSRLRKKHHAPYSAFLDFTYSTAFTHAARVQMISNSPELFLRVTRLPDGRRKIVSKPIKGTRANMVGEYEKLLHSEKDKAELAMIVDLQRNDLGRICQTGSVVVTEPRRLKTLTTVIHGVATIEGILREDVSLTDILRATFPCGSVTGCPKIRAMEIIEELEPVRRDVYCGAIGWVGGGELELSVAIRTMTVHGGHYYVPVGGGIVADSEPLAEYHETMVKSRAMHEALGLIGGVSPRPA